MNTYTLTPPAHAPRVSTYHLCGGAASVTAIVDEFYIRILYTGLTRYLADLDEDGLAQVHAYLTNLLIYIFGGPATFDLAAFRAIHKKVPILDSDYTTAADLLASCLTDLGAPARTITQLRDFLTELRPVLADALPRRTRHP